MRITCSDKCSSTFAAAASVTASFLCLLVAIGIYILFRDRGMVVFRLIDAMGMGEMIDGFREDVAGVHLAEFILYSLPDGLYAASYVILVGWLLRNASRGFRFAMVGFIPILGVLSELLQPIGLVPGTFDVWDLVCFAAPYIIYIIEEIISKKINYGTIIKQ